MDQNKLKVLQEINYSIRSTCKTCSYSDLSADGWGYCNLHKYSHKKHVESVSRLSINQFGHCSKYERSTMRTGILNLHAFTQFFEDPHSDE